jgi:hypothetical protein
MIIHIAEIRLMPECKVEEGVLRRHENQVLRHNGMIDLLLPISSNNQTNQPTSTSFITCLHFTLRASSYEYKTFRFQDVLIFIQSVNNVFRTNLSINIRYR